MDHHKGFARMVEMAVPNALLLAGDEVAGVLIWFFQSPKGKFAFDVLKIRFLPGRIDRCEVSKCANVNITLQLICTILI